MVHNFLNSLLKYQTTHLLEHDLFWEKYTRIIAANLCIHCIISDIFESILIKIITVTNISQKIILSCRYVTLFRIVY